MKTFTVGITLVVALVFNLTIAFGQTVSCTVCHQVQPYYAPLETDGCGWLTTPQYAPVRNPYVPPLTSPTYQVVRNPYTGPLTSPTYKPVTNAPFCPPVLTTPTYNVVTNVCPPGVGAIRSNSVSPTVGVYVPPSSGPVSDPVPYRGPRLSLEFIGAPGKPLEVEVAVTEAIPGDRLILEVSNDLKSWYQMGTPSGGLVRITPDEHGKASYRWQYDWRLRMLFVRVRT